MTNHNFILDATPNLNKRLGAIEAKYNDAKLNELHDVIETKAFIDELVVLYRHSFGASFGNHFSGQKYNF